MSSAAIESLKRKVPWGAAKDLDVKLLICFIATCISKKKKKKGRRHKRLCLTLAWELLLALGKALGTASSQIVEVQRTASLLRVPLPGSLLGTHTYAEQKWQEELLFPLEQEQASKGLPAQQAGVTSEMLTYEMDHASTEGLIWESDGPCAYERPDVGERCFGKGFYLVSCGDQFVLMPQASKVPHRQRCTFAYSIRSFRPLNRL